MTDRWQRYREDAAGFVEEAASLCTEEVFVREVLTPLVSKETEEASIRSALAIIHVYNHIKRMLRRWPTELAQRYMADGRVVGRTELFKRRYVELHEKILRRPPDEDMLHSVIVPIAGARALIEEMHTNINQDEMWS